MWRGTFAAALALVGFVPIASAPIASAGTSAPRTATAQFQPGQVVLSSAGGEVFALGFKTCGTMSCPELWAGNGSSFVRRVAPPGTTPRYFSQLIFANSLDGYALGTKLGDYATTNGGISWTHVSFGSAIRVFNLVASDDWFYAVTAHCVTQRDLTTCDDYRLERSRAGSITWLDVPIPDTSQLAGSYLTYVDVTAWGREVSVLVPGARGGQTLMRSVGGLAPLRTVGRSRWSSTSPPGACQLAASSSSSMWEICQTGMHEAWLYSNDGGGHFRQFWWPFGTAGVDLDPVSGNVAFRYTGVELPRKYELELTTNGGVSFTPIDHLSIVQIAFLNRWKGYVVGATNGARNEELFQTSDGGHSWGRVKFGSPIH